MGRGIVYFAVREAQVDAPFPQDGRMTLPAKTLTLLVFISLGLNALLLLILVATASRKRPGHAQSVVMDDVLKGVLDGQTKTYQRLEQAIRQLAGEQQKMAHLLKGAVQRVGLV